MLWLNAQHRNCAIMQCSCLAHGWKMSVDRNCHFSVYAKHCTDNYPTYNSLRECSNNYTIYLIIND